MQFDPDIAKEASGMPLASPFSPVALTAPFRLGVVGSILGRTRYGEALAALHSIQIAALADADRNAARAWARQIGGRIPVFDDADAMFLAMPDLDGALISSATRHRAADVAAAANAGIPVFCEIPFATDLLTADSMLRLVAEQGILLLPAFPRRFDPLFSRMALAEDSGALGRIRQARCDWSFPAFAAGGQVDQAQPSWHTVLQQLACQTVDISRWWLGEAVAVSADIDRSGRTDGREYMEGLANIIVTHERGQSVHHLARVRSTLADEGYRLTGELGHLELVCESSASGGTKAPTLTLHRSGLRPEAMPTPTDALSEALPASARAQRLLLHFAECVRTGRAPRVSGTDARAALEVVLAANLSTDEGSKISLPLRRPPDYVRHLPPGDGV